MTDVVETGRRGPRWAATARPTRWLAGLAALLTVVALGLAALAVTADAPRHTRVVPDAQYRTASAVDAAGCPIDRQCVVRPTPAVAVITAVRRAFDAAPVRVSGLQTVDASGHVWATHTIATLRSAVVRVAGQCVPGGTAVASVARTVVFGHDDLPSDARISYVSAVFVVGGAAGCSVVVTVDAGDLTGTTSRRGWGLSRDPTIMVRP